MPRGLLGIAALLLLAWGLSEDRFRVSSPRKHEIVELGLRSLFSGTLATCISGAVVGML